MASAQSCMGIPHPATGPALAAYGQTTSQRDGFGAMGVLAGKDLFLGGFGGVDRYRELDASGHTLGGIGGLQVQSADGVEACAMASASLTEFEYSTGIGSTLTTIETAAQTFPVSAGIGKVFTGTEGTFALPALRVGYVFGRSRTTTKGREGPKLKSDSPFGSFSLSVGRLPGFMTVGVETYAEKGSKPLFFARVGFAPTPK